MTGNGRPLAPYLRQSRAKERTISIEEQRRDIQRWAAANGVELAPEIVEQNVSGSKSWRERALGDAVDACERGEVSGIIVAWQDRLSRENGRATAEVWEALEHAGARLVCAAEGLDTATGDHEMLFAIKAAIAREQWKRYRANWERSQRSATERGIPNGQAPYGYRKRPDGRLEIYEPGARKVREAFRRRASGEPYAQIGRRFGWGHSTTRQLLVNTAYLGIVRCGAHVNENAHDAIVTREQFDAANAARTVQPVPPGDTTRDRILLGLARCAGCGHTLKVVRRGRADGSYAVSYFCKNAATEPCEDRAFVHADDLDAFVAEWFSSALVRAPRMVDVVAAGRDLEQAQDEQVKVEAQLNAYVENADATDAVLFQRGFSSRQKRVEDARAQVRDLLSRVTRIPVGGSLIDLWAGFDSRERRDVLGGFINQVVVSRGASSDLAGNVRIDWLDGSVAYVSNVKSRVRVAAA